jgi:hypothetical protein
METLGDGRSRERQSIRTVDDRSARLGNQALATTPKATSWSLLAADRRPSRPAPVDLPSSWIGM